MTAFDDGFSFRPSQPSKQESPPTPGAPARLRSLQLNCGVVGVYGNDQAADIAALALHALQHRGEEACGLAAFGLRAADPDENGNAAPRVSHPPGAEHPSEMRFTIERHAGLIRDSLGKEALAKRLPGHAAIAHCRYSTSGKDIARNTQPLYADFQYGGLAVAHNGTLTNARTLRDALVASGHIFQSVSDTEVILHLAAASAKSTIADRFVDALDQVEGGYALVALTDDMLIAARDPTGIRPLVIGRLGDTAIVASESCALDLVGATTLRDVGPGEVVIIDKDGVRTHRKAQAAPRTCAFEYIYFARPDSKIDGVSVYEARRRMGRQLAIDAPANADVVVPVPDGGIASALGYAEQSGLPFEMGVIRNHFIGRTFIQPTDELRLEEIKLKHSANRAAIEGKRVVLVDDSIVRGHTSRKIVQLVRNAGATEVHFRSASPQIRFPDFYGIDMPAPEELLAQRIRDSKAMARDLCADSLQFLSIDGLYDAIIGAPRRPDAPQLTDHYFTGEYPTPLTDLDRPSPDRDRQLSFLDAE